ncbi:MAG: hypothetical protein K6E30_07905 [Lachnospiraceae bacterium]|nr:hypothetical protein [Lachnospiraceae bacterium]
MDYDEINQTQADIIEWIRTVKFRKKLFGGVDEADVLQKMEELNRLYEAALLNERARYDTLLSMQARSAGYGYE